MACKQAPRCWCSVLSERFTRGFSSVVSFVFPSLRYAKGEWVRIVDPFDKSLTEKNKIPFLEFVTISPTFRGNSVELREWRGLQRRRTAKSSWHDFDIRLKTLSVKYAESASSCQR